MHCETCAYWSKLAHLMDARGSAAALEQGGQNCGTCHSESPAYAVSRGGGFRVFPVTVEKDWCGKWKQAEVNSVAATEEPKKRIGRPPKKPVDETVTIT